MIASTDLRVIDLLDRTARLTSTPPINHRAWDAREGDGSPDDRPYISHHKPTNANISLTTIGAMCTRKSLKLKPTRGDADVQQIADEDGRAANVGGHPLDDEERRRE